MSKYLCWNCKVNIAEWVYMPGYAGKVQGEEYFCDDCISSPEDNGCSCNWHYAGLGSNAEEEWEIDKPKGIENKDWRWIDEKEKSWIHLDEKGRPYPCCEFDYEKGGFDIERKFEFTPDQLLEISKLPFGNEPFVYINIHTNDGRIIEEFYDRKTSYVYILAEDPLTNGDILKFSLKL